MYLIKIFWIVMISSVSAEYAIINCSWPCPDTSHGCIVTSQGTYCGERTENSWILNSAQKAPYYTGASVSINLQPCQLAPFPLLPPVVPDYSLELAAATTTTTTGKQLIEWPIDNPKRPYDIYLGNCGHGFYCSSTSLNLDKPVCKHRFKINERCESSNQCITSFCSHNGTCQALINNQLVTEEEQDDDRKEKMTVEILASVFGIVGGFAVIGISLFLYRRYKLNLADDDDDGDKIEEEIIQHSSIIPLRYQRQLFASDFEHEQNDEILRNQSINQTQQLDIPPPSYKP